MYREYFGLKESPFSIAPDPRYLFMSHKHREALAHLLYGINNGGFVLLTGEVGTGKTTVCRCLLEQLPENIDIAFLLNPKLTVEELLAVFCDELGIPYPGGNTSIKVFIDRINAYLLDAYARGRNTVLILEEAQNLGTDVLEQLRLLTNLETNQQKLLQIILVGQPELQEKLEKPEMRQLAQRITARYHLGPLSREEVEGYVAHRLSVAGAHARLFPPSTTDRLFRLSGGIPRLINIICDRALLGAYVQGQDKVDKTTLVKAAQEVFGKTEEQKLKKHPRRMRRVFAGLMLLAATTALGAAFLYYRPQLLAMKSPAQVKPAAAVTEAPKPVLLEWPSDQPIERSRDMAFETLFRQWGVPFRPHGSADFCRQARAYGLGCLEAKSSLSSLLHLNRPAVLKLFDDQGREYFATLTSLLGETATFVLGTETRTVDRSEIGKHWLGDYTLFWRLPPEYTGEIRPGSKGPGVRWLEKQLTLINGEMPHSRKKGTFDDALAKEVKKFQVSAGLVPDGVVGPQTIIHINTASETDEPLLYGKKGDG